MDKNEHAAKLLAEMTSPSDHTVALVWDALVDGGWSKPHIPSDAITMALRRIVAETAKQA